MAREPRGQEIPYSLQNEPHVPIETINPATGERVQSYPALTSREIEDRLAAAHRASLSWRQAPIALRTVVGFLEEHPGQLDLVRFVLYGARDLAVYSDALARL